MDTAKYAALIRAAARERDTDLDYLSDKEVINYYENSLWGQVHQLVIRCAQFTSVFVKEYRRAIGNG